MTRAALRTHPPRLAAWLVDVFASAEQAESILGDLHEEFSDIVSDSGVVPARRWYWRHGVKTIFDLASATLWGAPWPLAGIVLLGFLLRWLSATLPERVIVAILRMQRPYSNLHYGLYVWLVTNGIPIVAVVQTMLIGSIVAILAKGRELLATVILGIVFAAPLGSPLFLLFVPRLAVGVIATVLAGVIVRMCRSSEASRLRVDPQHDELN
jgi:hypothetical protein